MSREKLYPYQGKDRGAKELADMCYPKRNVTSMRDQINRMGVEAAMAYDPIKGEQLGRRIGQRAAKGQMLNYVSGG
jgi:hypothetical protein